MSFERTDGGSLVLREQSEGLDVEYEAFESAIRPELRGLFVGDRIVAAVDFDDRELFGVEAQPVFRALGARRIKTSGLYERCIGPGRIRTP
jgi:hypothetical protein